MAHKQIKKKGLVLEKSKGLLIVGSKTYKILDKIDDFNYRVVLIDAQIKYKQSGLLLPDPFNFRLHRHLDYEIKLD
jgi:hypothetical protein